MRCVYPLAARAEATAGSSTASISMSNFVVPTVTKTLRTPVLAALSWADCLRVGATAICFVWWFQALTLATLRFSMAFVRGHCISCQLRGTMG